jgi:hypothetical protein
MRQDLKGLSVNASRSLRSRPMLACGTQPSGDVAMRPMTGWHRRWGGQPDSRRDAPSSCPCSGERRNPQNVLPHNFGFDFGRCLSRARAGRWRGQTRLRRDLPLNRLCSWERKIPQSVILHNFRCDPGWTRARAGRRQKVAASVAAAKQNSSTAPSPDHSS